MNVVISSGHGKFVRGASGYLDEVDEARRVVPRVAQNLRAMGVSCITFNDDVSTTQTENLNRIVAFHNSKTRDLDVSVHFNSFETTGTPMGTECLYVTQGALAQKVATMISEDSGLKNRGPKKRTDLFFLNKTVEPAILIEVCFVDSLADAGTYEDSFSEICAAIGEAISGVALPEPGPEPAPEPPPSGVLFTATGKVSSFGGPDDSGVSPTEGLAFITAVEQAPQLFLPYQPTGATGLARRLNPYVHYVACRWDYSKTPKPSLLKSRALVRSPKTGISLKAFPADWGPNQNTGRVADISPGLMEDLGIKTDDQVVVTFPV
jgi:N-acetylmuramoyl-L-alanine amidase